MLGLDTWDGLEKANGASNIKGLSDLLELLISLNMVDLDMVGLGVQSLLVVGTTMQSTNSRACHILCQSIATTFNGANPFMWAARPRWPHPKSQTPHFVLPEPPSV